MESYEQSIDLIIEYNQYEQKLMFIISPEAEAFIKSLQWKFLFRNASHIIFYQWDQYMIVPLSREAVLIDCMIYWPQYNCEYPATNMTQQAGFPPINT